MSQLCTHPKHHVEITSTDGLAYSAPASGITLAPEALSAYVAAACGGTPPTVTAWAFDYHGRPVDCPFFAEFLTGAAGRRLADLFLDNLRTTVTEIRDNLAPLFGADDNGDMVRREQARGGHTVAETVLDLIDRAPSR